MEEIGLGHGVALKSLVYVNCEIGLHSSTFLAPKPTIKIICKLSSISRWVFLNFMFLCLHVSCFRFYVLCLFKFPCLLVTPCAFGCGSQAPLVTPSPILDQPHPPLKPHQIFSKSMYLSQSPLPKWHLNPPPSFHPHLPSQA